MMKILVDADSCPVKNSIVRLAKSHHVHVIFVKSFAHFSNDKENNVVETIYVDNGPDSVDYKIVQLANKGDIIITQDYGLASLCITKSCTVLHYKGFLYTDKNINKLLELRYHSAMARKSGVRTKGTKAYTEEDRKKFEKLLKQLLTDRKNKEK